jgi:betaine-aldehyde dehydrogenase
VSQTEPRVLRNFINGEYVDARSGAFSDVIDPSTAQIVAKAPISGTEDLDAAFGAAATAFEGWGQTTPSERQRALLRIADAIEARAEAIVAIESSNTGKPIGLTMSEEIPPAARRQGHR